MKMSAYCFLPNPKLNPFPSRILFLFFLIILVFSPQAFAQTNVSGTISQNTTWTLAPMPPNNGSPYIVIGNITVNPGVTLTIEPGVEVKFAGNYSLTVNGTLSAAGTSSQNIRFTSNQTTPATGDWVGIRFLGSGTGTAQYSIIEYADKGLYLETATASITNNTIRNNNNAVYVKGSSSSVTNNTISNNTEYAAVIEYPTGTITSPDFNSNTYSGNNPNGIHLIPGPSGYIDRSTTLTKDNAPYIATENINVLSYPGVPAVAMTIQPGVEIRFDPGFGLNFTTFGGGNVALNAQGTQANPIVMISNAAAPAPGDWKGLYFSNATVGSLTSIDYLNLSYAGNSNTPAIFVDNVTQLFSISHSTIQNNSNKGFYILNSSVNLSNNTISNNAAEGIYIEGKFSANVTNNTISNSGSYPVTLKSAMAGPGIPSLPLRPNLMGNTYSNNNPNLIRVTTIFTNNRFIMYHDLHLTKDTIDYEITENILMQYGVTGTMTTLTVDPGVTVLFGPGAGLEVGGALNAQGTPSQPIVFTSNAAIKAPGDWIGLSFLYYGQGELTVLDHCTVEYAGQGNVPAVRVLGVPDPLTIKNSSITNNLNHGIYVLNSSPSIINNSITNNVDGISLDLNSLPIITDNVINLNSSNGIYLNGTATTYPNAQIRANSLANNTGFNLYADGGSPSITVNAENNWWGATDIPTISSKIFDNADNPARPVVDFIPFLYAAINPISGVSVTQKVFDPRNSETTSINYQLGLNSNVTIKIYDFDSQALVRTLLNNAAQTAGPQSIVFDGRDNSAQLLADDVYSFVIEARNISGDLLGLYSPGYTPTSVAPLTAALTPALFDPFKGQTAEINYNLPQEAFVRAAIGILTNPTPDVTLFTNKFRKIGSHEEIWNGRDANGQIVSPAPYNAVIFTTSLPENGIVIKTNSNLSVDSVKADPFIFRPFYAEVTNIEYTISGESAQVTVAVEQPSGALVRTLVSSQLQTPGIYTVQWDGKNGLGQTVSTADNYRVRVTATGNTTGVVVERIGNISVFK